MLGLFLDVKLLGFLDFFMASFDGCFGLYMAPIDTFFAPNPSLQCGGMASIFEVLVQYCVSDDDEDTACDDVGCFEVRRRFFQTGIFLSK